MSNKHAPQSVSSQGGFTLIETLLYITVASVLLLSVTLFFTHLIGLREKDRAIGWVDAAGVHAMDAITRSARHASGVISPSVGASASKLVIDENGSAYSFFEQDGVLVIESVGQGQTPLTPAAVQVSGFQVSNYANEDTLGVVDISFGLSIGSEARNTFRELFYEKQFNASAALRP